MVRFVLLLSLLFASQALARVSVTTYNMGQLSSWGFDFVACTTERVEPQIMAIFQDKNSPIYKSENFVLFIQEAWTWKVFRALRRAAEKRGFKVYPRKFELLKNNGQMTITNLKPLEIAFHPYSIDKQSNKGMLYMKLDLGNGKTLGTLNVHTSYSTAYKASELHLVHLEEINKFIERFKRNTDYFVLGGDFNAGPDMEYKYQQYDAARIIWNEGFIPHMKEHHLKLVGPLEKKTWEAMNPLVRDPPFIIQFSYFFWNLTLTWDQIDSTIDHVFVSESVDVSEVGVVFDRPVKLNCFGREDDEGLLPLSDHYGVNTVLKI